MRDILNIDFTDGEGSLGLSERLPYFKALKFTPESASIEREATSFSRTNGVVQTQHPRDITYKERKITVQIKVDSGIDENFYQHRHEIYRLLTRPKPYYISSSLLPNRRFLVTCDDPFEISKADRRTSTSFTVVFTAINGLAESIHTSSTILNLNGENWNIGMNMETIDDKKYSFTNQNFFRVFNMGDAYINTVNHDYKVSFKGVGKNISLINHTTGEIVTISDELKKNQEVKNVRQYLVVGKKRLKTSGRMPGLDIGWNEFEVRNCKSFNINFNTRFYYK